jgi:riboflavin transporter FmnP
MDTKTITLIIAFAALTIALNTIRIPTFYWPGFYYRVYEIPIVVAFLLFGPKIGTSVTVLNLFGQMVFFPVPGGIVAYPFGLIAILVMMLGVYSANMLIKRRFLSASTLREGRIVLYLTVLGVVFRTVIMPFLDFVLLYHFLLPLALGRSFTEVYMVGLIPGMIVFNATVPLYTIPISYFVAKRVNKSLRLSSSQQGILPTYGIGELQFSLWSLPSFKPHEAPSGQISF